jgi:hypothetical protein
MNVPKMQVLPTSSNLPMIPHLVHTLASPQTIGCPNLTNHLWYWSPNRPHDFPVLFAASPVHYAASQRENILESPNHSG